MKLGGAWSAQRAWADGCRRLEHGSMLVAAIDPPERARPYSIYGIIETTEFARILAAVELVYGTAELTKPASVGRCVGMQQARLFDSASCQDYNLYFGMRGKDGRIY